MSIIICVVFAAGIAVAGSKTGASIADAAQRFLTFYAGVFALVALTAAVAAGLVATDRIIMSAGSRIVGQAVHRALAFVAVAFLATHILMEIMIGKSQIIDSAVPFLARGRTFYIGLGTIAADLLVLIAATGIVRKSFAGKGSPLVWRTLHGAAYVAWPLSIVHGLAAGRTPKPYVSWSYGACMIAVGLALIVRSVATVRPRRDSAGPGQTGEDARTLSASSAVAQAYLLRLQAARLGAGAGTGLQYAVGTPGAVAGVIPEVPSGVPADLSVAIRETPTSANASSSPADAPSPPADGPSPPVDAPSPFPGAASPRVDAPSPPAPGAAPAGSLRTYAPAEWARYQTPADGIPVAPDLESVPYRVEALRPSQPHDPGEWTGG